MAQDLLVVGQEVPMLDTTTTRKAQHTTPAVEAPQAEQLVVEQIMQPFMGNRDWAQLVTPRVEAPADGPCERGLAAGELASTAGECWLPEAGFETTSFLSGLW